VVLLGCEGREGGRLDGWRGLEGRGQLRPFGRERRQQAKRETAEGGKDFFFSFSEN
jgi:hypothetical protein